MHNTVQSRRLDITLWYLMKVVWYSFSLCVLTLSPLVYFGLIPKSFALCQALHGPLRNYWIGTVAVCFLIGCSPALGLLFAMRNTPSRNPFVISFKQFVKPFLYFMMMFVTPFAVGGMVKDGQFQLVATLTVAFNCLIIIGSQLCGHVSSIRGYWRELRQHLKNTAARSNGPRQSSRWSRDIA